MSMEATPHKTCEPTTLSEPEFISLSLCSAYLAGEQEEADNLEHTQASHCVDSPKTRSESSTGLCNSAQTLMEKAGKVFRYVTVKVKERCEETCPFSLSALPYEAKVADNQKVLQCKLIRSRRIRE